MLLRHEMPWGDPDEDYVVDLCGIFTSPEKALREVRGNIYFFDELSYFVTEKITLDDESTKEVDEIYLPIEKHGNGKFRDIIKYFGNKESLENELKTNKNIYAIQSIKINEFTFVDLTDYVKENWKTK
ncbi:hypothetical protein [uncultured Megamonas sp.]|uniref:hypothetical protein n=1 Tax=uncultured Megamonas sp. TaxID=286140 RepID=UPI00259BA9C6|nr:hypothetical protein [uncultured Megamonas sp.]